MRRTALIGALIAALALTACGSDKPAADDTPPPTEWDAAAIKTANDVGAQIHKALPGTCEKVVFSDPVEYATLVQANMKTEMPLAVAECEVASDENLELSVFADAARRDKYVTGRTEFLCNLAKKRKIDLSGLRWITADAWSAQFDTEAQGRRIADALGDDVKYEATNCDPNAPADWDTAGIAKAEELAGKLTAADLNCKDLTMENRDDLRLRKITGDQRLPTALGTCSLPGKAGAAIAVFDSKSIARDEWITALLKADYCERAKTAVAIPGPDWAVFLVKPDEAVSAALGGEAPVGCQA